MSKRGIPTIFSLCVLFSLHVFSQDKIYMSSDARQGRIVNITKNFVSYRPVSEKNKTVNIPLREVLLVFNEKGAYMILPEMNLKDETPKKAMLTFLGQNTTYWSNDEIFKTDKSVVEGKITKDDNNEVEILANNQLQKISKNSIAVIIYKDGRHSISTSLDIAKDILNSISGPYAGMYPTPSFAQSAEVKQQKDSQPNVQGKPDSSKTGNTVSTQTPVVVSIDNLLANVSKKEFEERVMLKTREFSNALKILCDKTNSQNLLDKAIDGAVTLFADGAVIETSSVNRQGVTREKIRPYLTHLKFLNYDHIDIEWTSVQYVQQIKLAPDGSYRGAVTFEQKFSGYRDGVLVYQDVTVKNAEVILKSYTKMVEGQQKLSWDILLNDVSVTSTQRTLKN